MISTGIINEIAFLEFRIMYQGYVIANQEKEINRLKNKKSKTKVYHVVWATGHIQTEYEEEYGKVIINDTK